MSSLISFQTLAPCNHMLKIPHNCSGFWDSINNRRGQPSVIPMYAANRIKEGINLYPYT